MRVDPVCNMVVGKEAESINYQGKSYYFCSQECLQQFQEDPELYLAEEMVAEEKAAKQV